MDKVDKLINIIRDLKEEVSTNSANSAGLGFNPNTESPPVFKKKYATNGRGSRAPWLRMLRRGNLPTNK